MAVRVFAIQDHREPGLELDRSALIVDRQRLFAEIVTPLLEDLELRVSVATMAEAADAFIWSHRPKLALVDLTAQAEDWFTLGRSALAARPDAIVIGVTTTVNPRRVRESRRAGFHGCLTKDMSMPRFKAHVQAALQGHPVLPAPLSQEPNRGGAHPSRPFDLLAAQLTSRELEVLALLADGAGSSKIAQDLGISWNTVRTHAQSILTKLQVHSRLEAAAVAVQQGLVPDPAGFGGQRDATSPSRRTA